MNLDLIHERFFLLPNGEVVALFFYTGWSFFSYFDTGKETRTMVGSTLCIPLALSMASAEDIHYVYIDQEGGPLHELV